MSELGPCTSCGTPYGLCPVSGEETAWTVDANGNATGLCCEDCMHLAVRLPAELAAERLSARVRKFEERRGLPLDRTAQLVSFREMVLWGDVKALLAEREHNQKLLTDARNLALRIKWVLRPLPLFPGRAGPRPRLGVPPRLVHHRHARSRTMAGAAEPPYVMGECGFLKRNPFTGNMAKHLAVLDEPLVLRLIALTTPDHEFYGDGVEAWVCPRCAETLDELYKAVTPRPVE